MKLSKTFFAIGLIIGAAAILKTAVVAFGVDPVVVSAVADPTTLFTAMATVQSAYSENIGRGLAGLAVNMRPGDAISRTCQTSAGIGFGLAVSRGTDRARGCVLGGNLDLFLGVSLRDVTLEASQSDEYAQYQNVGVCTAGEIWVVTSVSVDPDEPVHYDGTTGQFKTSGGVGPIVGARWMDANDGAGLARLHLPNYSQAT